MKQTLLFLLTFFLMAITHVQAQVQFEYDAAGNRIERNVINLLPRSTPASQPDSVAFSQPFSEMLAGGWEIKIYPNPTQGILAVEITELENITASFLIFDMQGKLLEKKDTTGMRTEIDLSNQLPGTYLLMVNIGEETSTWKIIKQ